MLEAEGQKEHHLKKGSGVDLLQEKIPDKLDLLPSAWCDSSRRRGGGKPKQPPTTNPPPKEPPPTPNSKSSRL